MRRTQHSSRTRRRRNADRGSALLITLVVVAGLSLLGLAFVTVSETESAISINQRNALQTQAIAESGARAVVEWFQDPVWARGLAIMPSNSPAPANMKRTRVVPGYTGVYKPLTTQYLFDKPYRPSPQHRFYGDEGTPDITINDTIDATTMTNLNTFLFGANSRAAGRVSEIKVYAPPMVGGTLVNGFWTNGERFGTATIAATAEKWTRAVGGTLLSRKTVRIVVGEFPMPIPAGPIQTASSAQFGGSFDVHWGDEVALGNLNPSVSRTRLPWQNPFDRPAFERGYDEQVWPVAGYQNFLAELVGKTFEDPWAGSRARGTNSQCGTCGAYTYNSIEGQPVHAAFQGQVLTTYPTMRAVTFPTIRYDTWKRIALQGRGTKGLYYFEYVGGGEYKKNGQGVSHPMHYWVNTRPPGSHLGPGFYFFDTIGGVNPQNLDGTTNTGVLAEAVDWNSPEFGGDFLMSGFIYMNIIQYGSQGAGNAAPVLPYNMPGEVFRDVGHWHWTGAAWAVDAGGNKQVDGAGDGEFSFQDLNGNGKFDVVTEQRLFQSYDPTAGTATNRWVPKTWRDDAAPPCTVPPVSGPPAATDCSEPHEPYLNMIYPDNATDSVTIGWEPYATQGRKPRDLVGTTEPNCVTTPEKCTSNAFDRDGGLVDLPAILNGVMYNEGKYQSQGNCDYFGSVLIHGNTGATGNAQVWFDEKLIKNDWSPPGMPRVIVYNSMTDDQ